MELDGRIEQMMWEQEDLEAEIWEVEAEVAAEEEEEEEDVHG